MSRKPRIYNQDGRRTLMRTPQQTEFLKNYTTLESPTFGNAYRSAIAAGYAHYYASQFVSTKPKWLMDGLSQDREGMLMKAERNLDKALDMPLDSDELGDRALKATMFVAERLGRKVYGNVQEDQGNSTKILILPQTLILKNGINIEKLQGSEMQSLSEGNNNGQQVGILSETQRESTPQSEPAIFREDKDI